LLFQGCNKNSIDDHEIAYSRVDQLLIHRLVTIRFQPAGLRSKNTILKMLNYTALNQN